MYDTAGFWQFHRLYMLMEWLLMGLLFFYPINVCQIDTKIVE